MNVLMELEKEMRRDVPTFQVGDVVRVHLKIVEGERERVQVFQGTVTRRHGSGVSETFTVRRSAADEGVERIFPVHSPRIEKIEIVTKGSVRRAKLYYLRGRKGKSARVKRRLVQKREKDVAVSPVADVPVETPEVQSPAPAEE